MGRKNKILEERNSLTQKLQDLQKELEIIENKRIEDYETLNSYIEKNYGKEYFCGVIIDNNTLLKIMELILEKKENVKIPFNLYIKE